MRQVGKCCGEPLHWLIAEAPSGCGLTLTVGSGIPVRLWRCAWCECVTVEGWVPPTWVNAIATLVHTLRVEIEERVMASYGGSLLPTVILR
jgi:hypothetical protein